MRHRGLLTADAIVNLVLGVLLLLAWPYGEPLTRWLGVPAPGNAFYASILGAVLVGIGIALLIERRRAFHLAPVGLGLGGAIAINLCGGIVLAAWLLFGGLKLPMRGWIVLGAIDATLLAISAFELAAQLASRKG
jgi:hypothetical protein